MEQTNVRKIPLSKARFFTKSNSEMDKNYNKQKQYYEKTESFHLLKHNSRGNWLGQMMQFVTAEGLKNKTKNGNIDSYKC